MIRENINNKSTEIYTWPHARFPFYYYFKHKNCRIFILENVSHNFIWLKNIAKDIRPSDYFFVMNGWYAGEYLSNMGKIVLDHLGISKDQFIIMCNDIKELQNYLYKGFQNSIFLNHNAWLDENLYQITNATKIYDAILIGRADKCKRLHLANEVKNLALITGNTKYGPDDVPLPKHVNNNDRRLTTPEIVDNINKAYCGLCLSAEEGACYASSEYLLCGIPVVSTQSLGGRDIWYNEHNAVLCNDTESGVAKAVTLAKTLSNAPHKIRNLHILMAKQFRRLFIDKTQEIFIRHELLDIDAEKYYNDHYIHQMKKFYTNEEVAFFIKELVQ